MLAGRLLCLLPRAAAGGAAAAAATSALAAAAASSGIAAKAATRSLYTPAQVHVSSTLSKSLQAAATASRPAQQQRSAQLATHSWQRRLVSTASGGPAGSQSAAEQLGAAIRKARWLSVPVGSLAGLFGSIVGVGGGVVIVPMIVSSCKSIPQRLVSGTSLAAVVSTALVSSATYGQSGLVDPTAALLISPVAMLAAPWGARWTAWLDCTALRRALGWFLIAVAPLVPLKAFLLQGRQEEPAPDVPTGQESQKGSEESSSTAAAASPSSTAAVAQATAAAEPALAPLSLQSAAEWLQGQREAVAALPATTVVALCATGAIAGFASGLLGIGGGTIVTPLLALTQPYGQATVLGTSLLSMIPPSIVGLAQHHRMGNVDWRLAAGLALGTAAGGMLGSKGAVQAPTGVLEACFTLGMLLLGRKTLQSARR